MASSYNPRMHVNSLDDKELNYELSIRNIYRTSDNYYRRRQLLKKSLDNEINEPRSVVLQTVYSIEKDMEEITKCYSELTEIYEGEAKCTKTNIDRVETILVHLNDRMMRVNDKDKTYEGQIKAMLERLMHVHDEVVQYRLNEFERMSSKDNHEATHKSAQNGDRQSDKIDQNDLISLIEQTLNRLIDQRMPSQSSGQRGSHPHRNRSRHNYDNEYYRNNDFHNNGAFQHDLNNCDWYDEPDNSNNAFDRGAYAFDRLRPSSTRFLNNSIATSYRVNVLDWRFHFSGLDRSEDPKAIDVEAFIQKIRDHGQAENMNEYELINKVQQLFRGPAADWYTHARKSIHCWNDFTHKLRSRFASANTVDDIRQEIYSKKQKAGESTLRFIDQFVNLINRLPERTTEYQCVRYILNGIRTEVARMARTANIRSVDELVDYVKTNYGPNDKFESRPNAKSQQMFHSTMRNKHSNNKIELMSDEEYDFYEQDEHESYDWEVEEVSNKPLNQVRNERNRNIRFIQNAPRMNDSSPNNMQTNENIRRIRKPVPDATYEVHKNPCPYCNGDHSYKSCPLPPEKKQRHCFFCKSTSHLASVCPKRESAKTQPPTDRVESNESTPDNLTSKIPSNCQLSEIECALPPPIAYVKSLIFFPKEDQRPYTTATANDHELIGLLDTGSHVTVIGQNLYETIEWNTPLIPHDTMILTADGTRHQAKGVLLLKYKLGDKIKYVPTLVMPIVMKKPIFGIDFQRQFNIQLLMIETISIDEHIPKQQKVFDPHTLSTDQQSLLTSVINSLPAVSEEGVLNCTGVIEHSIDTGNNKPVYSKPYIFSPKLQEKIRAEIFRMINRGIIKKISESSWLNAVVPVPKSDGSIRLCINAKKLNAITKKNRYNPTNIERIFSRIPSAKYFSSIDLKDAFYQIPLAKKDQAKTAFSIHGMGIFAYERMPQGLVNSAATLSKLVESIFNIETEPEIFVYVDDFIICSNTFERHIELLKIVSEKLKQVGLAIGLKKSKFCRKRLQFLGHEIDENGISIDSSRMQAIETYKKPTTAKEVRSFLGFAGWHRKFIKQFGEMSAPLVNLTKKSVPFNWTQEHDQAFQNIKSSLINASVLYNPDYTLPFHVDSTSSSVGTSAILYQMIDKEKHIIAYMSSKLNELQQKYHPIERECLALIIALEKFRHYIEGNKIIVTTDQCSLNWLRNCTDPTGRIARWALRLQAYDFELKSKHFSANDPISVLSREIDLMSTPSIFDYSYEFECNEMYISTVDIIDVSKTQDDWYSKTFESIKSDPKNENFKIVNDILYHRFDKIKKVYENEWKICVPQENRLDVLKEQHDSVLASHPGVYKTVHRIQNLYYWPKMTAQINEYVRKCEICRTTKSANVNTHTHMGKRRETDFPFRTLSIDFVGPMTMSKKQNQYLFVVIDNFTKFVCLKPMRTAKTENVTKFLEEEVFLRYGVCENLICDNGVQFASKGLANLMSKYSANLKFTPFYYPQANPCEIANKSIMNAIRSYVAQCENQRNWDAELAAITCALNCHIHTATDMSPYYALHGHDMMLKGSDYSRIIDVNGMYDMNEMGDKHATIRQAIGEHLFKAYQTIEKTNNKRAGDRIITLSKDTYLKNMKLSNAGDRYSKKLGSKYIPVKITKQIGENTFLVSDKEGKILGKYHSSLLIQR